MLYHTRSRGRPKNQPPEKSFTKKKRDYLLGGLIGSIDDPIDLLQANKIISPYDAEALRTYQKIWVSSYGPLKKYAGSSFADAMISGSSYEHKEEDVDHKIKVKNRYHKIDSGLEEVSKTGRYYIRKLCEGYMPDFLAYNLQTFLCINKYENQIKSIESSLSEFSSRQKRTKQNEYNSLLRSKRILEEKLGEINNESESIRSIYCREQTRTGIRFLKRSFYIDEG